MSLQKCNNNKIAKRENQVLKLLFSFHFSALVKVCIFLSFLRFYSIFNPLFLLFNQIDLLYLYHYFIENNLTFVFVDPLPSSISPFLLLSSSILFQVIFKLWKEGKTLLISLVVFYCWRKGNWIKVLNFVFLSPTLSPNFFFQTK